MSAIQISTDPYNSRIVLDVTWDGPAEPVILSRYDPDLVWRTVRGGDPLTLDAGAAQLDDFEAPLDIAVKYAMRSATSDVTYSEATLLQSQGVTWLKHPWQPTLNLRIFPTEAPATTRSAQAGLFPVLGRRDPIAVTTHRGSATGTLRFATNVSGEVSAMQALLDDGSVLQLCCPPETGVGTLWIAPGDLTENRYGHYAIEPARSWELTFTAVERPA